MTWKTFEETYQTRPRYVVVDYDDDEEDDDEDDVITGLRKLYQ
jgi:hypothetical protein